MKYLQSCTKSVLRCRRTMILLCMIILLYETTIPRAMATESVDQETVVQQLTAIVEYLTRQLNQGTPMTESEIATVINDSASWIVQSQQADGRFGYEYVPFRGEYTRGNVIVRQAGTFYALAEFYRAQTNKDPDIAASLDAAMKYFIALTHESKNETGSFLCVTNSDTDQVCQLGTSALVLLGLLSYATDSQSVTDQYEEYITGYKNYLVQAHKDGKGFSESFVESRGFASKESPFFNGEAMLALVRYYTFEPDPEVKQVFLNTFAYVAKEPHESALYLWMMAALKHAILLWPDESYVEYATTFTATQVTRLNQSRTSIHNYCAPLEGLVAAHTVLATAGSSPLLSALRTEIEFWLRKMSRYQLQEITPYRVAKSETGLELRALPDPITAHGGFLTGQDELRQRIDFTQHCLSAYLQTYEDILGASL